MTIDELDRRLNRLAPTVDDTAAFAALRRPRGRRGAILVAVATAVVIVGVAALLVTRDGHSATTRVAVGPSSTTTPAPPFTASTSADGIELTVTLDVAKVVVGTRVHAHVVVHNSGTVPVYWAHGGCAVPAAVSLVPHGVVPATSSLPQWDGVTPLAQWLGASNNALGPSQFVELAAAGVRSESCTDQLIFETIVPGAQTEWDGVTDARIGPSLSPDVDVLATFLGFTDQGDYPRSPRPALQLQEPVPVVDDPARAATVDAAITAFAADRRLQPYLDDTRHELDNNPIPVTQSWSTELSWWQGGWELFVSPRFSVNGTTALRLRYDPTAGTITDARIVSQTAPPGDDPDHNSFPGQPPDTILK